jgi:hypothetical protein
MLMPAPQTRPYGVASWAGEHRFMIRCGASDLMLMSHLVGQTCHWPITRENTAWSLTHRFRRGCRGHRVQEMASSRTAIVERGPTLQVCQYPMGNRRPRHGDRERPFPRKPIPDKRPDTPPAVPRRPPPIATQQLRARRQVIAAFSPKQVKRDT